jgi:hypothetical protein
MMTPEPSPAWVLVRTVIVTMLGRTAAATLANGLAEAVPATGLTGSAEITVVACPS